MLCGILAFTVSNLYFILNNACRDTTINETDSNYGQEELIQDPGTGDMKPNIQEPGKLSTIEDYEFI